MLTSCPVPLPQLLLCTLSANFVLSAQSQEKPTEGEVLAMGPGKAHPETGVPIPLPCDVGDKVFKVVVCRLRGKRAEPHL